MYNMASIEKVAIVGVSQGSADASTEHRKLTKL